jgi:hypothetical protein
LGSKENIHLCINPASVKWVDAMLDDLRAATTIARNAPADSLAESIQAMVKDLDPSTLTAESLGQMLAMAGIEEVGLPERMAGISGILNSLPPALSEKLLTTYFNDLYRYREP